MGWVDDLTHTFDILEVITNQLGYRLSLDRLAEKTLQVKKAPFNKGIWKN